MTTQTSALQKARATYQPKLPKALRGDKIMISYGSPTEPATDREEIRKLFPSTYGLGSDQSALQQCDIFFAGRCQKPLAICSFVKKERLST